MLLMHQQSELQQNMVYHLKVIKGDSLLHRWEVSMISFL